MSEPSFRIEVDDLELRLLAEDEAATLFGLVDANRARLREWLGWVDGITSVQDQRAFVEESQRHFANDDAFPAGIWAAGNLAGVIGFVHFDRRNRSTEIGYWLSAEAEGRGIMTRACRVLVDYAIHDLAFHRVEIRCATGNMKSAAVATRLGFTLEGTLRDAEWLYDHWVDHLVFSTLETEWRRKDG